MADEALTPFNVSFNTPNRTIITFRGATHEDLVTNLALASAPVGPDGGTLLEMIAEIDSTIAGGGQGGAGASQGNSGGGQQQGSANPPCPTCGGPTQYKDGVSAKGKWAAYLCTTAPRGQKHEAVWL
jgi:hypothetical protein